MKILYYDCFSGISGDMNLGALIDLGVDSKYLIEELSKLGLNNEYEIKIEKDSKMGITGTKVSVILKNEHHHEDENNPHNDHTHHHHEHSHDHDNTHSHCHEGHNHHQHSHDHVHRNLKDIEEIINSSDLNDRVKKLAIKMFIKIAEAEAKVHGKDLYEVHFHEVGAVDSIVDIVGAAICIDYLKPDKIMASPVQVGSGYVKCDHGIMPVPAPATVEILKGAPIKSGRVKFETTTPTGAAILAANVDEFVDSFELTIDKVAYGLGQADLEIANVLRVYLATDKKKLKI